MSHKNIAKRLARVKAWTRRTEAHAEALKSFRPAKTATLLERKVQRSAKVAERELA